MEPVYRFFPFSVHRTCWYIEGYLEMNTRKEIIRELVKELKKNDRAYYLKGTPLVPDSVYDEKKARLKELRPEHPYLLTVGCKPESGKIIKRETAMGSIENGRNLAEVLKWMDKYPHVNEFYVSPKIDALSGELVYSGNEFVGAYTRGDGETGTDITQVLAKMKDIPKFIVPSKLIVVRGEIYLSYADFKALNKALEEQGKEPYRLPRSAAAGLIKSGTAYPSFCPKAGLKFLAWEMHKGTPQAMLLDTEYKRVGWIKNNLEIATVPRQIIFRHEMTQELLDSWAQKRKELPYPIDGMVITLNNVKAIEKAGKVGYTPKGKLAYKFPPTQKLTKVTDITVQVGRTGQICPVVWFTPIVLDGSRVEKANGHNFNEMKRVGIEIGAVILVEKAGDIIPDIVKTTVPGSVALDVPTVCPECKVPLIERGEHLWCENEYCPCRVMRRLVHFCKTLGMLGFGKERIEKLTPVIRSVWDVFTISKTVYQQYVQSVAIGNTLYAEVQKVKEGIEFAKILDALGMDGIGTTMSKKIAEAFHTPQELLDCTSVQQIRLILQGAGVINGSTTSKLVPQELYKHRIEIYRLNKLTNIKKKKVAHSSILAGMTVSITGTLPIPRNEMIGRIESNGGVFSDSLTKACTHFIVGEKPGKGKREKAEKLGITITDESLGGLL